MTSLHISHTVRDLQEWLDTFESFADFRTDGGVLAVAVRHGIEEPNLVAVDLDFAGADQARAFLRRLETEIWPHSPHLDGTPTAELLELIAATA